MCLQAGLKDKWGDDVMEDLMRNIRLRKKNKEKRHNNKTEGSDDETREAPSQDSQQPLTTTHMQGPFWLLLLGLAVACVTFVTELVVFTVVGR